MDSRNDSKNAKQIVLPGDKLATIEEFEPGPGSAVVSDAVVATRVGTLLREMPERRINVVPAKDLASKLPETGDTIIGSVQSAASSIAQIQIEAVNDVPSSKELAGMLSLRDDRRRRSSPVRPGDIIKASVISTTNAIYHLSLEGKGCGVLHTVCSNCGGRVIAIGRDRVKCTECGFVDDRLLSDEFAAISRSEAGL